MPFTDRFIKIPIQVYDRKLKELTGADEAEDSWMKINPMDISNYRPSYDSADLEQKEITSVTLKTGDTTLVYLTIEEFEELLNNHA